MEISVAIIGGGLAGCEAALFLDKLNNKFSKKKLYIVAGANGVGKTTFVKEFVSSFGIKDEVSSPTFSILNIYDDKIYHYDIYNEGVTKFIQNGMLENLELSGYHMIEWGDESLEKILKEYGFKYIVLNIEVIDDKRYYKVINDT